MRPKRRSDNLTNFICLLFSDIGVSFSWNPQGPSRPAQGYFTFNLKYLNMTFKSIKSPLPYSCCDVGTRATKCTILLDSFI